MRKSCSRRSLRIAAVPILAMGIVASPAAAFAVAATTDHYLDIPGIGRVPIPMPPGSRVFGPKGESPAVPHPPPAPERAQEAPRPEGLDDLFARLSGAESEAEASALARAIARFWMRSGSPTADLLLVRARVAAETGDSRLALELFDHILALEPAWTQPLVERADIRLAAGDAPAAERDLEAAVRLDPRRFDALGALGMLHERAGAPARALEAYRRALSLDPSRGDWRRAEERLRLEVEGRDI